MFDNFMETIRPDAVTPMKWKTGGDIATVIGTLLALVAGVLIVKDDIVELKQVSALPEGSEDSKDDNEQTESEEED